jgi:hypothetical protein
MSGWTRRHNLSDWLALHELDPPLCRRILGAAASEFGGAAVGRNGPGLGNHRLAPDIAWSRAVDAMCASFPEQRSFIEDTFARMSRELVSDGKSSHRALTLDNGPAAYPTVIYRYLGKPSDALVVAHEFSHALQIRASRGKFVTPIMREVCAFIGEMALLSRSLDADAAQHRRLLQVWHDDNRKYFESDGDALDRALHDPDTAYRYCWNYPIARYIATRIAEPRPRENLWVIFEGKLSVGQALGELDGSPQLN